MSHRCRDVLIWGFKPDPRVNGANIQVQQLLGIQSNTPEISAGIEATPVLFPHENPALSGGHHIFRSCYVLKVRCP